MRLSEYQAQLLLQIAIDSLPIVDHFTVSCDNRKALVNAILNQQDTTGVELGGLREEKPDGG